MIVSVFVYWKYGMVVKVGLKVWGVASRCRVVLPGRDAPMFNSSTLLYDYA
jgi:hypothetical protein